VATPPDARDGEATLVPAAERKTTELDRPALGDTTVPPTDRVQAMPDGQATWRISPLPASRPSPMLVPNPDGRALGPIPEVKTETDRQPTEPARLQLARELHNVATVPGEPTEPVKLDLQPPTVRGPPLAPPEPAAPARARGRGLMVAGVVVALLTLAFGVWFAIWRLVGH